MKPIGIVYEEEDYSLFRRAYVNRIVTKTRTEDLIKSISEKELLIPITVTKNYEVVEGQGRFEALKSLGRPIKFVIDPNATTEDCRIVNRYNSRWSISDYVDSYCKSENSNYLWLKKAADDTEMSTELVMKLSDHARGSGSKSSRDIVAEESLTFTEEDYLAVVDICKKGKEILNALGIKKGSQTFYKACRVIVQFNGYDHQRMIKNCGTNRYNFTMPNRMGDVLAAFEEIYNYNAKKKFLRFTEHTKKRGCSVRSYDGDYTPNAYKDRTDISTIGAK